MAWMTEQGERRLPNFQTFTQKGVGTGASPQVSIQRGGVFSINAPAFALLGKPEAVEFVLDAAERVMGFRPATPGAPHAYAVRKQKGVESFMVSGRSFAKYAGIDIDHGARYPAELIDGVLAVDLKADPITIRKPRAKKPGRANGTA
jgi:hypothetical protein